MAVYDHSFCSYIEKIIKTQIDQHLSFNNWFEPGLQDQRANDNSFDIKSPIINLHVMQSYALPL